MKNDEANQRVKRILENSQFETPNLGINNEIIIYFLISLIFKKEEFDKNKELNFGNGLHPECIYTKEISLEDGSIKYIYIFKLGIKIEKKSNVKINFINDKGDYEVSFEVKNASFIYELNLYLNKKKSIYSSKTVIQDSLKYHEKVKYFIGALTINKEKESLSDLYKDTINLYSKKPNFEFLINLFIILYENKSYCPLLMGEFKKMNEFNQNNANKNNKLNEIRNTDRNDSLNEFDNTFQNIIKNADRLIKTNSYQTINFYGIILCYLNFYNFKSFSELFDNLYKNSKNDLFEILLIYKIHFKNWDYYDINFYIEFIDYSTRKCFLEFYERALFYLKDVLLYLKVIEKNKEKIISIADFKPIALKDIKFESNNTNNEFEQIINTIEIILNFSEEKQRLLIVFTNLFWDMLLRKCNNPNEDNIANCSKLRKKFIKYCELVNKLYKDIEDNKFRKEANIYKEKDNIGFLLDKNIKNFIKNKNDIENIEILTLIKDFNIYYTEDRYINKRNLDIFDKINFQNVDFEFIEKFKTCQFEKIFKNNINNYLQKFCSKIKNINDFDTILNLINDKEIEISIDTYIELLSDKYDSFNLYKNLLNYNEDDLYKNIKILCKLYNFFYLKKNWKFLSEKISKLDEKIKSKIYIILIRYCNDSEHDEMKKNIIDIYVNDIKFDKIDELMVFIQNLEENDYEKIMEQLRKKYIIKEDDFFIGNKNIKIELLYNLFKNGLFKENNSYYDKTKEILEIINKELEEKHISINAFINFFEEKEEHIIKKLELLSILNEFINSKEMYKDNKELKDKIKKTINDLKYIKDELSIYHKDIHKIVISDINDFIKKLNDEEVIYYENNYYKIEPLIKKHIHLADTVHNVKNLTFFRIFYECTQCQDPNERFDNTCLELKNINNYLNIERNNENKNVENNQIFNKIKEEFSNNDIKNLNEEYDKICEIFNLPKEENKNSTDIDQNLGMIANYSNYQKDIKSIFYFFNNFDKSNAEWNKFLLPKYQEEADLDKLKKNLEELKEKKIYNYSSPKKDNYIQFFNYLYDKKQAYEFLLKYSNVDIKMLNEKLDPSNTTITYKDIQDTQDCVGFFNELKKMDNFEILKNVKTMDDILLKKFKNFVEINESIIDLNKNFDSPIYLYKNIKKKFTKAKFIFNQDNEDFTIIDEGMKKISFEELKNLKNKVHIRDNRNDNIKQYNDKYNLLIDFKKVVNNIEIIYDYMNTLRNKGSSLPIFIKITIDYPEIKYYLDNKELNFPEIQKYLFNVKNNIINKLDILYKDKANLRFLYGKQFDSILKHLEGHFKIDSIMRYILNKTNKENIKDGFISNPRNTDDYVHKYDLYNNNSFDNISNYITSLFKNNNLSLEKHYRSILIKEKDYKGIYLYESKKESKSMKDDILKIFLQMTGNMPIAQNILISNKETSYEEMQSYFNRAILCQYNTLFVIEINDSFSDYQQKIMNNFIDKLLNEKNQIYNKKQNENIEKNRTNEYLESCIIFIYKGNESFLDEIKKINPRMFELKDIENKFLMKENIHIYISEVSGLGKSTSIKNAISNEGKYCVYFPLGGNLSKDIIYKKLSSILKSIKTKKDYSDVAIHLDLYENKEKSILNEFLFSFLITKFYSNGENIIYIPKNIEIFIEIPNCFNDYLSDYDILKSFNIINITFNNKPCLNLPDKTIDIFNKMLDLNTNELINDFVSNKIGTKKFTYHQVNIFINLFISQYNKFKSKLKFFHGNEEKTEECINNFAEGTKYFTLGVYSKFLTEQKWKKNDSEKKDYIDLLSNVYKNDLKNEKYKTPLIFIIKEKKEYVSLNISDSELEKNINESQDYYLVTLKEILSLENPIDNDNTNKISLREIINRDDYIITNDNFKKMILILYRIVANIPVILMGETGCGKTALIKKLNQILNDGNENVEIININPGINDKILIEKMNEINKKAKNKELWVFFDELNTCESLALLTEIFINRSYNGNPLNKNIRLIGACNPYRKKRENKIKCGLSYSNNENELIYLVKPLPQSLLYYVFNFGSIQENDEKKYIFSIISELFTENEKVLKENTKEVISECHKYLRMTFDPSIVSLRELARFKKCYRFLLTYFSRKNELEKKKGDEKLEKIKSIIISIYLCYYIRLINDTARNNFDSTLIASFIKLVNNQTQFKENDNKQDLLSKIDEPLKSDINDAINKSKISKFEKFSQLLLIEENFVLGEIELDKGIGLNKLLKENIFLLFISLVTKIPLIIIGKPGSGKSLSSQLIYKSMRGKFSKSKFFQMFPSIIQSYFQGSYSTVPEEVESIFEIAAAKLNSFKKEDEIDLPISMILFDELGLAERSKSNPLKVLHSKLEYDESKNGVSFVGISNWSLDAAKINRGLSLSVPDLDDLLDDLVEASTSIAKSINKNIADNNIFVDLLPNVYFQYKKNLKDLKLLHVFKQFEYQEFNKIKKNLDEHNLNIIFGKKKDDKIKIEEFLKFKKKLNNYLIENKIETKWLKNEFSEIKSDKDFKKLYNRDKKINIDFHGNRDFFYLIKGIANDYSEVNKVSLIEKNIERNFGGLDIDLDVDLEIDFEEFKIIKDFINDLKKLGLKKNEITSVLFLKEIFNSECNKKKDQDGKFYPEYIIPNQNLRKYDLNTCINNNINDCKSRYLLLEINPSLAPLIHQNITKQNPYKQTFFFEGSPFIDDHNSEYQFEMINEIQLHAGQDHLIIMQNLKQIYAFLYDLFNMNYIIKDSKKYARICQGNLSDQLTYVNDNFRCIIMVDKKFITDVEAPFLNRFEKMIISFAKLLNESQKKISKEINLKLKKLISEKNEKKINYKIKDLLIGCKKEDIQGLVYNYWNDNESNDNNNEEAITEKIFNHIFKLLSQDIVINLDDSHKLKQIYNDNKNIYNLKEYIDKINESNDEKYKISIIYTFSNIRNLVNDIEENNSIMISEIKSETQFKNYINAKINNLSKSNNFIFIHFECSNSSYLSHIIPIIKNKYNKEDCKFIFIVHVKRNFTEYEKDNIYVIPGVYKYVNQLFIDNLNGKNIKLNSLLNKPINEILKQKYIDLDEEFGKNLRKYINKELNVLMGESKEIFKENYCEKLLEYFESDCNLKNRLIEKSIDIMNKEENNIIERIYKKRYVNKNSVDITSVIIQYITDNIISESLLNIFKVLEDNNFLSSLLVLKNNILNKELIEEIKEKLIKELVFDQNKYYTPKFNIDYSILGFYNFYEKISNFIISNIRRDYIQNEKKLREFLKGDSVKETTNFHDKEEILLNDLIEEVQKDKFAIHFIPKLSKEYILRDYITFFLFKYINKNNEFTSFKDYYYRLINLILNIRFNENNKIINKYRTNDLNILLIKIIWLESNMKYIIEIINIYNILQNNIKEKQLKFIDLIEDRIKRGNINYIINEAKNPKETKEVNECYYIVLASICYSITSFEIKTNIHEYFSSLNKSFKIIRRLNDDLYIFLNEMYIIDELFSFYEVLKINNKIDLKIINQVKENLKENCEIIQKNNMEKIEQLIKNFNKLNELFKDTLSCNDNQYYDFFKYIYWKEIKKINDINYRENIFEEVLKESEIIIKSNDILQLLLKNIIIPVKENFIKTISKILNERSEIINLMENILNDEKDNTNNSFILSETLLYYFEKNSHIYLNNILMDKNERKQFLENEPLEVFDECVKLLNNYNNNSNNLKNKNKNVCKLFSIGYIKSFLFTFISSLKDINPKFKNHKIIIEKIKENNSLSKIFLLYIFKLIYNLNKKQIEIFTKPDIILKYKLKEFNFNEFINIPHQNPFKYQYNNPENIKSYDDLYDLLEENKKENFEKIDKNELNLEKYGIDVFYFVSYNLILSNLKIKDFTKSSLYMNFYNNICSNLFKNHNTFFKAIKLFYCPEIFEKIKKEFFINEENINIILFSYRYCINLLYDYDKNNIFSLFYNKNSFHKIKDFYYPGNDINNIPIYQLYSKIYAHFNVKKFQSNIGCYVCLCDQGYYFTIYEEDIKKHLNKKCPYCKKEIGLKKKKLSFSYEYINRSDYFRIVKDKEELKLIGDIGTKCITLDQFKEKYLKKNFQKEKGITKSDKNYFKNRSKLVRNLNQISYRLLNFILYSHLFLGRMHTENNKLDNFLPDNMTWIEVITESWELLKSELNKKKINDIELFMNYIFFDIFKLLKVGNKSNYDDFIIFEDNLENEISTKINIFKKESKNLNKLIYDSTNKNIYLLDESYKNDKSSEYPFYDYFYYTQYLNENYLLERLKKEDNRYPVLTKYIEYISTPRDSDPFSLNYLKLYNDTLNLFNEKYSHKISREESEQFVLEDEELYKNNTKLINNFIDFYNNLNIKDENNKKLELSKTNKLCNFFIDDNNSISKSLKYIYNIFIEKQNNEINDLIKNKVNEGIFDENSTFKVNIQNINDDEIFTLDLPKKYFIDIIFNCSHREVESTNDYKDYNHFQIEFDLIEEKLTEKLLENKKLFNNQISNFVYKNEDLIFENIDIITKFNDTYNSEKLIIDDKIILYQYYQENMENINLLMNLLNDFNFLISYLVSEKKLINQIKEKSYEFIFDLFEIIENNNISEDFKQIFNDKKNFTIFKLTNIFSFYQKLIFKSIKNEMKEFQIGIKEELKNKIIEYFQNPQLKINKEKFSNTIYLFITLFLSKINNKNIKIKTNNNNIINYLNIPDIWDKEIYNMKDFNNELNELKNLNIQLNQILGLYDIIGENYDENYFADVISEIKKNEEIERKKEEAKKMANHDEQKLDNENIPNKNNYNDDNYYDQSDDDNDQDFYDVERD